MTGVWASTAPGYRRRAPYCDSAAMPASEVPTQESGVPAQEPPPVIPADGTTSYHRAVNAEPPADRSETARPSSPRLLVLGLVVLVVVTILASLGVARLLGDEPVDGGTPPPGATSLTDEERAFYGYVAPRLRDLAAEARVLADLGAERSRNLIALQSHNQRVNELMSDIDAYAQANGVPDRFAAAFAAYQRGAQLTGQAVAGFQQAFLRFDWDSVGEAVDTFQAGAATFDGSVAELEAVGGSSATPNAQQPAAGGQEARFTAL